MIRLSFFISICLLAASGCGQKGGNGGTAVNAPFRETIKSLLATIRVSAAASTGIAEVFQIRKTMPHYA